MEEPTGVATIRFGRAIGFVRAVKAAEDIVLGGPGNIIADEKIEQAVAVVIKPQGRCAEALMPEEAAGTRGVHESPFTGVAEEPPRTAAGDQNTGQPVVGEIAAGH